MTISWLEALKNLDTETVREAEIATVSTSFTAEISKSLTQQGDKSAKRGNEGLLSLLAPPHIRESENYALRQGCPEKDTSTQGRPWLDALRSVEKCSIAKDKRATRMLPSSVDELPHASRRVRTMQPPARKA